MIRFVEDLLRELRPFGLIGLGLIVCSFYLLEAGTGFVSAYFISFIGALFLGHPVIEVWKKALSPEIDEDNNGE